MAMVIGHNTDLLWVKSSGWHLD